jgi:hypothetical protein
MLHRLGIFSEDSYKHERGIRDTRKSSLDLEKCIKERLDVPCLNSSSLDRV